jgi:hypothetical protein
LSGIAGGVPDSSDVYSLFSFGAGRKQTL